MVSCKIVYSLLILFIQEIGTKAEQREERSEEQEDPLLLKWEYPVILTLASLNLLLVSIVVVLARRHHNLRIGIKNQPRSEILLILLFCLLIMLLSLLCSCILFS